MTEPSNELEAGAEMLVSVDFERFDKDGKKIEHIRVYPDGKEENIKF